MDASDIELSEDAILMAPPTQTFKDAAALYKMELEHFTKEILFRPVRLSVVSHVKAGTKDAIRMTSSYIPGHPMGGGGFGPRRHFKTLVVGKMPGTEEVRNQRNFIGPSGKLLFDIAKEIQYGGINDWYVTNVVPYMPPDGGKKLNGYHIADGMYLLLQVIELIHPEYILLFGTDAVKALFGKNATGEKTRSQFFFMRGVKAVGTLPDIYDPVKHDKEEGFKVMTTIHPAAVCREVCLRPGLVEDMKRFKEFEGGRKIIASEAISEEYVFARTASEVAACAEKAANNATGRIAVDCEWGGGKNVFTGSLRTVQFSWAPKTSCVIILRNCGGVEVQTAEDRLKILNVLRGLFAMERTKLVGHNFRSDAEWLEALGVPCIEKLWLDTMLLSHVLNENAEHGLEACTVRYASEMGRYDYVLQQWLDANHYKKKDFQRKGFMFVPDEILLPYAARDADATFRIIDPLLEQLLRAENRDLYNLFFQIIMPANLPLHEVEMNGLLADRRRLVDLTAVYATKRNEVQEAIRGLLGDPQFNPRSNKQKQDLLFKTMGLTPFKTTGKPSKMWEDIVARNEDLEKYNPAVDSETLEFLTPQDKSGVVAAMRDFNTVDQVIKSFLRLPDDGDIEEGEYADGLIGAIDPDGRIHTSLSQMSETGRHKSSNPNCFSADTEVLTRRGWVLFPQLADDDLVAQYRKDTNNITFEVPDAVQRLDFDGCLRHIFTEQQIDLLVTPEHRCLIQTKCNGRFRYVKAADYPESHYQLQAGVYVGGSTELSQSQLILIAALQADGSVTPYDCFDFSFSKARKISRFESALRFCGIKYRRYVRPSGATRFCIHKDDVPIWWKDKKFFGSWLLDLSAQCFMFMSEEVWFWDGCYKRRSMFASSIKENTDWVQILTLLSGRRARVRLYVSPGGSQSWQVDAGNRSGSWTTNLHTEGVPYRGIVYCVTMPDDTVIVRRNNVVCITGQCQNLPSKQEKELERIMEKKYV